VILRRPSFCLPGLAGVVVIGFAGAIISSWPFLPAPQTTWPVLSFYLVHPVAALVGLIVIWRLQRTARASDERVPVCAKCTYVLEGLSEPRCPECGRVYTLDEFHRL